MTDQSADQSLEPPAPALGYLRLDVSVTADEQHRAAIKHLASKWQYTILWIMLADEYTENPVDVLLNSVRLYRAVAVFVPSARHFEGCTIPTKLVAECNVITVADKQTYARPSLSPQEIRSVTQRLKEMK